MLAVRNTASMHGHTGSKSVCQSSVMLKEAIEAAVKEEHFGFHFCRRRTMSLSDPPACGLAENLFNN